MRDARPLDQREWRPIYDERGQRLLARPTTDQQGILHELQTRQPAPTTEQLTMTLVAAIELARALTSDKVVTDWRDGCPCTQCELVRRVEAMGLLDEAGDPLRTEAQALRLAEAISAEYPLSVKQMLELDGGQWAVQVEWFETPSLILSWQGWEAFLGSRKREWEARTTAMYTTAPLGYDGFGTTTVVADAGRDAQRPSVNYRLVRIEPEHLTWQIERYASGGYPVFSEEQWLRAITDGLVRTSAGVPT